jgi:hypothetical protein
MTNKGDNAELLCQDCYVPLFRWFLSRVDWVRILKQNTIQSDEPLRKEIQTAKSERVTND